MTQDVTVENPATALSALCEADIDARISFDDKAEVMEVSFAGVNLSSSLQVNQFYDRIEERIAQTGEGQWFFLVNYGATCIASAEWPAFSRRGLELNKAHSMGTVRFGSVDSTRAQIEQDAASYAFHPNLFDDRLAALAHLHSLPSPRRKRAAMQPGFERKDWNWRIDFKPDDQIMKVDFSGFTFEHSRDVTDVYDFIESQVRSTGHKWYFLINYEGTQIQPSAWVEYAARGKKLNQNFSLGTVRYAPGLEAETDIRLRSESQGFLPNIRNTYADAYQLVVEMKAADASTH